MSNTYSHKATWHLRNISRTRWMLWESYNYYIKLRYYKARKLHIKGYRYITFDVIEKWNHKYCSRPRKWNNQFHDRPMRRKVKRLIIKEVKTGEEQVFPIFGKPFVYFD